MGIRSWLTSAASNTTVGGVSIAENMARSDVNNAMRAMMAEVAAVAPAIPVSVKEYGATGDGVTDDSAAIQAAFAASTHVHFPAGTYQLATGLTLTTAHTLTGAGMDRTYIRGVGSMDVLYANLASSSDHGLVIRDMTITNSTAVASQASGSGIRLNNVFVARIENVKISGCYNGIRATTSGLSSISRFFTVNCKTAAIGLENGCYDIRVSQFELTGPGAYGIKLNDYCDEHVFTDGVVSSLTLAVYTDASVYSVSQRPEFCRFANVSFDACTDGLDLGNCTDMTFVGCFISNRPGYGVSLGNRGTAENVQFIGCTLFNNGTHGLTIGSGATHTDIIGCKFISNSQTSVGVSDGIRVTGSVTNLKVIGNTFYNGWGLATGQLNGLNIAAAGANKFAVAFNDFSGASGATFTNASTAADQNIADNIGYLLDGTATYDPASLADGAGATTTVTVTGAALGDFAVASFSLDLQGITLTAWVSAANTVSVRFQNESGGVLDLASGTLKARVVK